jgi:hypothetical protein
MFVGTHLSAEHPERLTEQNSVRLANLGNGYISALYGFTRLMLLARVDFNVLHFIRLSVAILAKESNTILGGRAKSDNSITHILPPYGLRLIHRWFKRLAAKLIIHIACKAILIPVQAWINDKPTALGCQKPSRLLKPEQA